MSDTASPGPPESLDRTGLIAALICYVIWGAFPLLFHQMGVRGASAWEIVGWRTVFAVPVSLCLVLLTGGLRNLGAVIGQPRLLALLALSAILIATNWTVYVWAVSVGQTLSASLGYYINFLQAFNNETFVSSAGKITGSVVITNRMTVRALGSSNVAFIELFAGCPAPGEALFKPPILGNYSAPMADISVDKGDIQILGIGGSPAST